MADRYEKYVADLRARGASEDEIQGQIRLWTAQDKMLGRGVCPECRSLVTREFDHQDGPTTVEGQWYRYWCRRCGFLRTQVE